MKQVTLTAKVKGRRRQEVRLRLGLQLIRLGVWVAGFGGIEFEYPDEKPPAQEIYPEGFKVKQFFGGER